MAYLVGGAFATNLDSKMTDHKHRQWDMNLDGLPVKSSSKEGYLGMLAASTIEANGSVG